MVVENEAVAVELAETTFDDALNDFVVLFQHAVAYFCVSVNYSDCTRAAFYVPDQGMVSASLDPSDLTRHRC